MSLKVGYAVCNINPELGFGVMGYYVPRHVKGFLDDLETSAVVLQFGEKRIAVISVDVCSLTVEQADEIKKTVAERSGINADCIFISTIHTHTGPVLTPNTLFETTEAEIDTYFAFLTGFLLFRILNELHTIFIFLYEIALPFASLRVRV